MNPQLRLRSLAALAALLLPIGSTHAASILWLQNNSLIDSGWQTLLTTNGHTVTAFTGNRGLPTQADKDFVNSFDLVVITRSAFNAAPAPVGGTQLRDAGTVWNTQVNVPLIMMQAYLPANHFGSNWGWTTTAAGGTHPLTVAAQPLTVHDATDPIWTGITVANGDPTPSALHTSNSHAISLAFPTGAVIIASSSTDNNNKMIARLPTGTAVGGGNLAGERLFFGMNSGNDTKNLTELGDQVFLNAVNGMAIPEPSVALLGGLGILALLRRRRSESHAE